MMKFKPFELERWFGKYEHDCEIMMGESGVKPLSIKELFELTGHDNINELLETKLGYGWSNGLPKLRELIAEDYVELDGNHIVVTNGAIEANFIISYTLLEPNSEVVTIFPTYAQLWQVGENLGARVKKWRLLMDNKYKPNINQLAGMISKNTDLIIINYPHNPTGACIERNDLEKICELAEQQKIPLLSDEIYRGLEYNTNDRAPPAADLYENAISVAGLSKVYGLPGLRIGWLACKNKELLNRIWAFRDFTSICNGVLNEKVASIALQHRELLRERGRKIAVENFEILKQWVDNHSDVISWVPPKAAVLTMLMYHFDMDSEMFCRGLIEQKSVFTAPGSCFETERQFRVGFGYDTERLKEGLKRLGEYIASLKDKN
jgi:aspartate/methionine/tyrosine aminotransferase